RRELGNFQKLCDKQGVQGVVRLNVLSDIQWERHGIPQSFPELFFLDYTKLAKRLGKTPSNYKLIFSYSDRPQFAKQVKTAQQTDAPFAVVFKNGMPSEYLDRPVVDGDQSDILNVLAGRVVIGLKAKGSAKKDTSGFVVDSNLIARVAA
ncbi:MAG: hypothetical protein CBB97_26540, partial [Candidatus Endolissoclinum sp. TMED37]